MSSAWHGKFVNKEYCDYVSEYNCWHRINPLIFLCDEIVNKRDDIYIYISSASFCSVKHCKVEKHVLYNRFQDSMFLSRGDTLSYNIIIIGKKLRSRNTAPSTNLCYHKTKICVVRQSASYWKIHWSIHASLHSLSNHYRTTIQEWIVTCVFHSAL